MKISLSHIREFLPEIDNTEQISDILFSLGHEHTIESPKVIDFEITPNRGDCLSILGISRDINASVSSQFHYINLNDKKDYLYNDDKKLLDSLKDLQLNFVNKAPKECPEIYFLEIEVDTLPTKYEKYLENYFTDLGINKNNFFADISNFVAYEIGQPTHCYDADTIKGNLILDKSENDQEFETLLGQKILLTGEDLVFKIDDNVIDIAGVMGDKTTACSKKTKKVLIECAYFKPEEILGKSRKYNLVSDASYKFERGTDPNILEIALKRFIKIVKDHAEVNKLSIFHFKNEDKGDINNKEIKYDIEKIEKILGVQNENPYDFLKILNDLEFGIHSNKILPPSHRHDIDNINDIAEEIARAVGYNNSVFQKNDIKIKLNSFQNKISKENLIRLFMHKNGFSEVINFPFDTKRSKNSLEILNPLDTNLRFLRQDLTQSLLKNLYFNERRQKDSIKLFEISDVYQVSDNGIFIQKRLGLIVSGCKGENYRDFQLKLDKNYLEELLKNIFEDGKKGFADLILNQKRDASNSKSKAKIFSAEIPLELISMDSFENQEHLPPSKFDQYKKPSEFPVTSRDLSFLIKEKRNIRELCEKILSFDSNNLKKSFLFDVFRNTKTNEVKMAFRFIFQSYKKTLTDKEVDMIISDIVKSIRHIEGVEIPGMYKQ